MSDLNESYWGYTQAVGSCKLGNEMSCSINCGNDLLDEELEASQDRLINGFRQTDTQPSADLFSLLQPSPLSPSSTKWTVYCNHLDWLTAGFITQYLLQSSQPVSVLMRYSDVTTRGREENKPQ